MLTVVLSGPASGRSPLLQQLQSAGVDVSDQPEAGPSHGLPTDPETGWVTGLADGLAVVEKVLARSDRWALRMHWPTPTCRTCSGHGKSVDGQACLPCKGRGVRNHRLEG